MPVCIPIKMAELNTKGLPPNIITTEKQIRETLKKADSNGDGYLAKDELKKAFKEFGSKMPWWRATLCLWKADTNCDGLISGEELDIVVDYVARYKKFKK